MAVDRLGRPLRDDPYRGNVRVYSASNITLSGLQTIDGVTLESGDRVLCNGQTTTSQNGIYVASTGVWSRSRDLSTSDDFTGPIIVTVEEGTTYRNTFWHMLPASTITVGTDAISFTSGYPAAQFGNGDALSVFGRASNSSGVRDDIAFGTDHFVLARSGTSLVAKLLGNDNVDPAAGIVGTKLSFTQAGTGAVARTVQAKQREIVTPQDFTASTIDDYTTDASTAIQAAIDYAATTGKQVYIPAGTYKVGTALQIKGNGTSLIGDGPLATILKSPNASNPIITFANGISQVSVRGLELNRAVTATAGGNGLETPTGAYIDCLLEDIWSRNNYIGFRLGATAFARGSRLRSEQNVSHGFYLTNSLAANGGQWYLHGIYSGNNGGDGFRAESDAAATTGFPIGELINYQSFGNTGKGFAAIGTALCPIQSVRLAQVFLGQDGDDEIYLDCYGVNHVIDGVFIELPGTYTTGPSNSTPAFRSLSSPKRLIAMTWCLPSSANLATPGGTGSWSMGVQQASGRSGQAAEPRHPQRTWPHNRSSKAQAG